MGINAIRYDPITEDLMLIFIEISGAKVSALVP